MQKFNTIYPNKKKKMERKLKHTGLVVLGVM